ncbi:MAG: family 43 glycosylhydrolase [Clostridia bacterium]|nr:family 43 glycosylhydrolase [Clostridia bacterium]
MKKFFSILLSSSILLSICACEKPNNQYKQTYTNSITQITEAVNIAEKEKLSPAESIVLTENKEEKNMYQNPTLGIENENIVPHLGIGDPFILRYNGIYYLYHSAAPQCWTSEDLVNWNYEGYCTEDPFILNDPWAPEVTYYNGKFYMIVNPRGEGPYFAVSDSPTGPFVMTTGKYDIRFDGSIFIDDNGEWYFACPGSERIQIHKMNAPTDLNLKPVETDCTVADDWTEGPMIIKYKDTYFMTYCGGEVSNEGYQIYYATSNEGPLSVEPATNNPIIINTDESRLTRLGHNSIVVGPNLDSLYIVYHSMESPIGSLRQMSIDPLYINGNYMQAFGPTFTEQTVPELPDIYSRFNSQESLYGWTAINAEIINSELNLSKGGIVLSEKGIEGDFTAEYNFLEITEVYTEGIFVPDYGKVGAIFDYTDANNYGAAYIKTEGAPKLEIVFTVNGEETVYTEPLKASFDDDINFEVLQMLTVKKSGNTYTILFNNKTVGKYESTLKGGSIGVSCLSGAAKIGFVGIEGNVWHSSYKEYYKPVEGEFGALLCVENDLNTKELDGKEYLSVKTGETYNYYINAEASCNYDIAIKYRSTEDCSFEIYYNGNIISQGNLPKTSEDRTEIFKNLNLNKGYGILTFKIIDGTADLFNYKFITSENLTETLTAALSAPLYSEGTWTVENGEFITNDTMKMLYGSRKWTNYSVSATFTAKNDKLKSNLLFRVTNESLSPKHSTTENLYYYIGYYVSLVNDGSSSYAALYKQNYGALELAKYDIELPENEAITVTAEVIDENIKIYLDGNLIIEYSDPEPFIKGAVGFSDVSSVTVKDLKVEPIS